MKHFLFFRRFTPDAEWGGTEVVIVDWLTRIDYHKCKVTLVVPKGAGEVFAKRIHPKNLPVVILEYDFPPWDPNGGWNCFKKMRNFFAGLRPHTIIFVQGWYIDFNLAEVLAAFSVTWGRVFMHENVGPGIPDVKASKKYFGFIPGVALWWQKRQFDVYFKAYFCKRILFVSKDIRNKFIELWNYTKHNTMVCYHGTDPVKYSPSHKIRQDMRETFKLDPSDLIFLSTARLFPPKCLDRLINAFDAVACDLPNVRLLMAGGGLLDKELRSLAAGKKCADRIKFLGFVNNVPDLLKMADFYVLSSDNEGLSLALMEGLASGLICISTTCPGSPEAIEDGVNGFLTDRTTEAFACGLKRALQLSDEQRRQMSEKARATAVEKFNVDQNTRNIFSIFGIPYLSS